MTPFAQEIAAARAGMAAGTLDEAMRHLERAHVIGQRQVWPHVLSHWLMLQIEARRGRPLAVLGQLARIVLGALGSLVGVVPVGNTGGNDINMFKRLPIPADLQNAIEAEAGQARNPYGKSAGFAWFMCLLSLAWFGMAKTPVAVAGWALPLACLALALLLSAPQSLPPWRGVLFKTWSVLLAAACAWYVSPGLAVGYIWLAGQVLRDAGRQP